MNARFSSAGRTLAYLDQGPTDGSPLLYCHGIPGSRLEPVLFEELRHRAPVRIISMDRPGYGESSTVAEYSLRTHAADLAALADHLGLNRFGVVGFSGGGIFALSAAAFLRQRVAAVGLVATPATRLLADPFVEAGDLTANTWQAAQDDPAALARDLLALVADGPTLAGVMIDSLSAVDQALLATGANREHFRENMNAAVAAGAETAATALARDIALMMADWGFDPAAVEQPVEIFHGADDSLLTTRHAEALADALPHARLELMPGAGHYAGVHGSPAIEIWARMAWRKP